MHSAMKEREDSVDVCPTVDPGLYNISSWFVIFENAPTEDYTILNPVPHIALNRPRNNRMTSRVSH